VCVLTEEFEPALHPSPGRHASEVTMKPCQPYAGQAATEQPGPSIHPRPPCRPRPPTATLSGGLIRRLGCDVLESRTHVFRCR
jgi:hypothetical protein